METALKDIPRTGREEGKLLREELRGALSGHRQNLNMRDGVYPFEIRGGLDGKAGVHEYILDKDKLTHQMWKDVPAPTGQPIR